MHSMIVEMSGAVVTLEQLRRMLTHRQYTTLTDIVDFEAEVGLPQHQILGELEEAMLAGGCDFDRVPPGWEMPGSGEWVVRDGDKVIDRLEGVCAVYKRDDTLYVDVRGYTHGLKWDHLAAYLDLLEMLK